MVHFSIIIYTILSLFIFEDLTYTLFIFAEYYKKTTTHRKCSITIKPYIIQYFIPALLTHT